MIDNVSSIGSGAPVTPKQPVRSAAPLKVVPPLDPTGEAESLETPPAEVLHALDHAQKVLADLRSKQLNLRYDVDPETQRVYAQLVDQSGAVVREIPARHALDLLSGEHAVDAAG
jgi:FlaG protein